MIDFAEGFLAWDVPVIFCPSPNFRIEEEFALVLAYVLTEKIKAALEMRDAGLLQKSRFEPFFESGLVHGYMLQEPFMADPVKAGFYVSFEYPKR